MTGEDTNQPGHLEKLGRLVEDTLLVVLLTAMIVLASAQIFLRNGFNTGFVWADELLRIMVLWLALAGAVAASRADRQINIDVLSRWLSPRLRLAVDSVIDLFTAFICGVLAWHAGRFVLDAKEFEDTLLGDLPAWWFQVILPIGFVLMAWRYLVFCVTKAVRAFRDRDTDVP